MKFKYLQSILLASMVSFSSLANVILVHPEDFINDSERTHFNGFELIPVNDGNIFTGGSGPYIEDLIQVEQINGDGGNDIWAGFNRWTGAQGEHNWYPNSADSGYTKLTLSNRADFDKVGFNYGTGAAGIATNILFELYNDGLLVLKGTSDLFSDSINYLGFSGGGFDEIRVRDNYASNDFYIGMQALAIDSIEIGGQRVDVPEPSSIALFSLAVLGLTSRRTKNSAS